MYNYPKNLFTDVRIEDVQQVELFIKNGDTEYDAETHTKAALVRVYDGEMWYTSYTNNLDKIQQEIDNLASVATPKENIEDDPMIKKMGSNKAVAGNFTEGAVQKNLSREHYVNMLKEYYEKCTDDSISEIKSNQFFYSSGCKKKNYYNSKGADIEQKVQVAGFGCIFEISVDGVTTSAFKGFRENSFEKLLGKEQEIIEERDRYLDYARNAVDVVPGEYTCVLAPQATAMFTHESFGHKSEADFMLNDKTLQAEWVMGKQVGNDKVSICDKGDMVDNCYVPYDDEGNKASCTWLIKEGVLAGRLHDSKSASVLNEEVTGNSRAQNAYYAPMVRMTNTYMEKGEDKLEDVIAGVKEGIYVRFVDYGTGMSTFTMAPSLCYMIRDGKIAEPVRVKVITGSVFKTLFDIDAVCDDFELINNFTCGKGGQSVPVAAGGPSIRVKSLSVN